MDIRHEERGIYLEGRSMRQKQSNAAKRRWQKERGNGSDKPESKSVLVLFLAVVFAVVFAFVSSFIFASSSVFVLVFALVVAFAFAVVSSSIFAFDLKLQILLIILYIIGTIIGGVIVVYQQMHINSLQANTISTTTIPNTYQGIVQGIYTNNPSSITFTTGQTWQGNISKISNLSIGADCTLIQEGQQGFFTSGVCR